MPQKRSIVNHCEVCGKRIVNKKSEARFCSSACRSKNYRQLRGQPLSKKDKKAAERVEKIHHCVRCGYIMHQAAKGQPKKFCSNGCKVLHSRERQNAAYRFFKANYVGGGREPFSLASMVEWAIEKGATYDPRKKVWTPKEQMKIQWKDAGTWEQELEQTGGM